jgi:hypothetical protein
MAINMGSTDRAIRVVAGAALLVWAIALNGPTWAYIGIVPLITGLIRWCPAYSIFGINSCKK